MVFARSLHLFATILALLTASPVFAAPTDTPLDPNSLAAQIMRTPIDAGQCAIAVGAEHTMLKQNPGPTIPVANMSDLAFRYGEIAREFGDVIAVAPPTMVVLNTDFGEPNPYAGISTVDAFKLLCATLSDSQWALLTGKSGLAMGDLTSDDQKSLFGSILGPGKMTVEQSGGGDVLDLTADKSMIHLRLVATTQILLQSGPNQFGGVSNDTERIAKYFWVPQLNSTEENGQPTSEELRNVLKRSGLDYASEALRAAIPLDGLKTVNDLVYRIGRLTKTELYVDPHYGSQRLTVVAAPAKDKPDSPPTAKASDLLKALALCVTGTYRQVGPAFVLTDDIMGVGTRFQMRADFDAAAATMLKKPLDAASDFLAAHHTIADLHDYVNPDFAPTADQLKAYAKENPHADLNNGSMLALDYKDLTSAQQAEVQKRLQSGLQHPGKIVAPGFTPSLANKVDLFSNVNLQFLAPSLPDPIGARYLSGDFFAQSFATRRALQLAKNKAQEDAGKAQMAKGPPPEPTLAEMSAKIPRRAVLVNAETPAEIKSAVAAMRTLDLNELWLSVFANGKSRVPGTKLSDPGDKTDIVADAVAVTKGTGITVYPVLDLLKWGPDAPEDVRDLTTRGEDSATDALRLPPPDPMEADSLSPPPTTPDKRMAVSPFSIDVQSSLLSVVRKVGAEPGIGGIVWRDYAPPGYDGHTASASQLGYTPAARLAFLRAYHADPVDVCLDYRASGLPIWDRGAGLSLTDWSQFRASTDLALLRGLRAAAGATAAKPVQVIQHDPNVHEDWYRAWDTTSAKALPPGFRERPPMSIDTPQQPPGSAEKSYKQLSVLSVTGIGAARYPRYLPLMLSTFMTEGWGGFVLDFDGSQGAELEGLERLGKALSR